MQGVGNERERIGKKADTQFDEREGEIERRAEREGGSEACRAVTVPMLMVMMIVVVVMVIVHRSAPPVVDRNIIPGAAPRMPSWAKYAAERGFYGRRRCYLR